MSVEEKEVDVLVVGSGAGGLTAAIVARHYGGDVLVVEKTDMYGGTTATSGGGVWIPCNHLMATHGESDDDEAAMAYLKACVGDEVAEERLQAYVREAPRMIKFLEDNSDVRFVSTPYSDYFPDRPGGKTGYRTLDPVPMSASDLGDEFLNMRPPHKQTIFGGFTITMNEAKAVITKAKGWQMIMARLTLAYWLDIPFRMKTKRHRRLALGNALVGRCLTSAFRKQIPIWRNSPLEDLIVEEGVAKGAIVKHEGKEIRVRAKKGVILAAGGFESNADMRAKNLPGPTDTDWSAANGNNTGDTIRAAEKAGVGLSLMDAAWWGPAVRVPGDSRARILFAERALPGIYIVNKDGERFLNEAASYDEVGRMLYDAPVPAWVVFDSTVRKKHAVGPLLPIGVQPDASWSSGLKQIIKKADTLEDLAEQMNVSVSGLLKTAERVKRFSETGVDEDFGKGGNDYDRYYGDPSVTPNPCMAPLEKGPFYAMPIYPGDIGTKGGVNVDINAQALDEEGRPVPGLYATGNNSSAVMGRTYPGAGSTIGPAMTFGYVAARHAMGVNE
ncbi:MAG: FAD-dependent oxidoreductase [Pseudomonadota bacterium]